MDFKMTIYNTLTSENVRNLVRRVDGFCARKLPKFHEKVFLPVKLMAKSALLKLVMTPSEPEELPPPPAQPEQSGQTEQIQAPARAALWQYSEQANDKFQPLVSVVVPNFNHAEYLRQRLETVYSQTYKNFEVILLDDASTDNSLDILREFHALHKDNTRLFPNKTNSGNVFKQWQKGIDAARGDLIWIAESDDYSAENFLETLIGAFIDESLQLAFVRTDFIQDGVKIYDTEHYLSDIPDFDWQTNFTVSAANFVARGMAIKNIIPNVSGVVFRKPSLIRAEIINIWQNMKLCGDWLFYLEIMKGGCVHYNPAATNFYRVHQQSTSLKIQKEYRYYEEHERIAEFIAQNYNVPAEAHMLHLHQLEEHYLSYFGGLDKADVSKYFSLEKILSVKRKPNILMCVFSMCIGGGETFPIILANEMHRKGYPVAVLDFQMSDDLPEIRKKVLRGIPFLRLKEIQPLSEVIEQMKIDIVHSHHGSVDEAITHLTSPSIRHIVTLHGMYEATVQPHLNNLLTRTKKSVSAFVYIADKNLQPFVDFNWQPDEHFYKIGNGLENFPIHPISRKSLDIPEKSFVCCVVSRAIPEKGWQAAIDAVELANKKSSRRIDLILVGAGEMYDKLSGKVSKFVHLTGFKSNVRDYLAAADIGLLPSEFAGESFPLMIIDSFFSGKPVVCSNLGEVVNMVKDSQGNFAGVVFDLVDGKVPVEKLSKILSRLANSGEYKKIAARVPSAAEKFSIDCVTDKYLTVYNEALQQKRP